MRGKIRLLPPKTVNLRHFCAKYYLTFAGGNLGGFIVDYKDLFKSLEGAVHDYTSGALDGYEKSDVAGLLEDRIAKGRERLDDALETVRALCEPVSEPRAASDYLHYFCGESGDAAQLKENEPKRLSLYKHVAALIRAYANLANELDQAGYTPAQIEDLKAEVEHFERVRSEVKLASADYIDLKMYEPAMRHLIDQYIRAEESEKISAFDDISLIQLIVERGADAVGALPESIVSSEGAVAETIENNVRKLIIKEQPINPKYYEKMSELLDALIEQRKRGAIEYEKYLVSIVELTKQVATPNAVGSNTYPASLDTAAKRALFDNLGQDENLALTVDEAVTKNRQNDWRNNHFKIRKLKLAVKAVLGDDERTDQVMEIVEARHEY